MACTELADEVDTAVQAYAVAEHLGFGKMYAYEVDGFGNRLYMDDPNVQSLIALAYLGIHAPDNPLYENTRGWFAWSNTLFGELVLKVRAERLHLLHLV